MAMAELKVKIEPEDIVDRVLDETYKGRTLREWVDALTQPKTKADHIRTMSDEDLAAFFEDIAPHDEWTFWLDGKTWLEWLRSEAKEKDNGRKDI